MEFIRTAAWGLSPRRRGNRSGKFGGEDINGPIPVQAGEPGSCWKHEHTLGFVRWRKVPGRPYRSPDACRTIQKSRLPGINPRYCPVIDHFSAPWAMDERLVSHQPGLLDGPADACDGER